MPGTITRTGVILSMPEFTQKQKDAMARAVAKAVADLSEDRIRQAVEEYQKSLQP